MPLPMIEELAIACVNAVHNTTGITLDFTQDTLPILDYYMSQAQGTREEILGLVAPMCGAYFGEVLRREIAEGRWVTDEDPSLYRFEFTDCSFSFNPIGIALEALLKREVDGYGAHFVIPQQDQKAVQQALIMAGEVREEDFFRLSVRYEVIEQIAKLLISRTQEYMKPLKTKTRLDLN